MRINEFASIRWDIRTEPVLCPPILSPIIADPSIIAPEDSPDGRWHLFAHSIYGIHHHISEDGIAWRRLKTIAKNAMRPCARKVDSHYVIYYEKYRPFHILFSWAPIKWKSSIQMRISDDLVIWSAYSNILEPSLDWMRDDKYGSSVSNPCLVKMDFGWRLYFSASLAYVPDCGFCEPRHIAYADSACLTGPYDVHPKPIISPVIDDPWRNLAAGAIKVIPLDDGYIGLQNGIYIDNNTGRSGSAILLLESKDGIRWNKLKNEPLIRPTDGWMRSHVYAVDAGFSESIGGWYLYFNARDDWHWTKGKEKIGMAIGKIPS
mgnify:CR=1 FL=1